MKYLSISKAALPFAIVAGLGMAPAQAADLGGDCCADLEERIAELEATTVRKGNRVMSLKLSGHVNRAVLWWDNGDESNVYGIDNANSSTRFRMTGSAKISSDLSAGFFLELGAYSARSNEVSETNDDGNVRIALRYANWYLNSKTLGKLTVGLVANASDGTAEVDLGGIGSPAYHNGQLIGNSISIYTTAGADTGLNLSSVMLGEQVGGDVDGVRYDSPTLMGFKVSASWGEDDHWAAALRFANEFGDFRVAAAVGYDVKTDLAATIQDEENLGASIALMHTPTGLWVDLAYSSRDQNYNAAQIAAGAFNKDRDEWAVSAGITQKFIPLGKTTVYGQYAESTGYQDAAVNGLRDEGTMWGAGIIQHIDAAAMHVYLGYRNHSFDLNATEGVGVPIDDIDYVVAGGKIHF